tara:strand:+ start:1051 stop:2337 length:1287 start_codon:yes stop_codon:yes gene_type:complete
MKTELQKFDSYSLASITATGSKIAKLKVSVDIHTENSPQIQATNLVLADALLSGAGEYSRDEFLHEVNKLGATIDVTTSQGSVTFTLKGTETVFPKLLQLFEVMVTKPTFSSKELKRIKTTTKNGLHQAREDSKGAALDNLRNLFYGNEDRHFSYSIDELIKAVDSLSGTHLKQAHKLISTREWFATVGGGKKVVQEAQKTIEKIRKNTKPDNSVVTNQTKNSKPTLKLEDIPSRQNIDYSIGTAIPLEVTDPEYVPLSFGIAVLAKWGGFAGRLMSTVRELEGLTYGIYGRLEGIHGQETGYFRIMTFFAPEKSKQALTSTFREITTIYKKGITDKEFKRFKTILHTGQALLNDSLTRQLGDLHAYHHAGFTLEEMREHKEKIHSVTKKEVNAAIKKYLDPKNMSVSGAGPTKAVRKELESWYKSVS